MKTRRTPLRPVTFIEAAYKALQVFLENSNESIREVSVLLLVFIPLDYWQKDLTTARMLEVLGFSVGVFVFGWGCGMAAVAVKRSRDRYEEEQGFEPGTGI